MTIISLDTARGRNLYNTALNYEGRYLHQIYDSWSDAKERAWEWCMDRCIEENGEQFGICSHNTFGFSVSWVVADGVRMETPRNSYLLTWGKGDK